MTIRRGGRFATCNGNAKAVRAFPGGNGVYRSIPSKKCRPYLLHTRPVDMSLGQSITVVDDMLS